MENEIMSVTEQTKEPEQQRLSGFEGGVLPFIGYCILIALSMFTLYLALPWVLASFYKWTANNTVIEGKRLDFDGTGAQLFGHYIKWLLLTIITLGIYSFWLWNKMMQWKIKHTFFKVEE